MDSQLNLEKQYEMYLQLVGLREKEMHPNQKIQTRRAFYGACGQMLVLFRDVIGSIDDEDDAIDAMEGLVSQVQEFWKEENKNI